MVTEDVALLLELEYGFTSITLPASKVLSVEDQIKRLPTSMLSLYILNDSCGACICDL